MSNFDKMTKISGIVFLVCCIAYFHITIRQFNESRVRVSLNNEQNAIDNEKDVFIDHPVFGDFVNAEVKKTDKISFISVWEPFFISLKHKKIPYIGNKQMVVEYDEKWTSKYSRYYSLSVKRRQRQHLYRICLFWKQNKIQGLAVKASFSKNPLTHEDITDIEHTILLYDRKKSLDAVQIKNFKESEFWHFLKTISFSDLSQSPAFKKIFADDTLKMKHTTSRKHQKVLSEKDMIYDIYTASVPIALFISAIVFGCFLYYRFHTVSKIEKIREENEHRVDLSYKFKHSGSELYFAILNNNFHKAKKLIKKGFNVNETDDDGDTLLMIAVYQNNINIVKYLLICGADSKKPNNKGMTPLSYAIESNSIEIIKLFVD